MKTFGILAIGLLSASTVLAGTNGGTAGAFARMGAGARAQAMGNAFTGLADGPAAVQFNPAALPFQTRMEFTAATSVLALDRRLDYVGFSAPLHPKAGPEKRVVNAGVGLAWLHGGVSDIDSRDFDGNPLDRIDMSSNLFMLGFGVQFHERFAAGVTAKVAYETFGDIGNDGRAVGGNGFGADFGVFGRPLDRLTVGAQVKDIGTKTTWSTTNYWSQGANKADSWPVQYRAGAAYKVIGSADPTDARWHLIGAMDVEGSAENDWRIHAGAEGAMKITDRQVLAGRLGLDNRSPTFGMGIGFALWKVDSMVDFTYVLEDIAPDDGLHFSWSVKY
jgi:hypothetical protein